MTEGEAGPGSGQVVEAGGLWLFRTTKAECKTEGEAGMILFFGKKLTRNGKSNILIKVRE